MSFLLLGGDGGIYNPAESDAYPVSIYGRTNANLYAIKIVYRLADAAAPSFADFSAKLSEIAWAINAIPIIGVAHVAAKRVKYYTPDGSKFRYFT